MAAAPGGTHWRATMSCTNARPPASPRSAMEASIMAPWASVLPQAPWACPYPTRAHPIPSHPHLPCPITAPRPTSISVSVFDSRLPVIGCVLFHSNATRIVTLLIYENSVNARLSNTKPVLCLCARIYRVWLLIDISYCTCTLIGPLLSICGRRL